MASALPVKVVTAGPALPVANVTGVGLPVTESTSDDALPVIIVPVGGIPVNGLNPPTWQWSFLAGTIPAGATFSRASSGTYFDANGVLQTATSNVPRFDHDPVTGVPYGYLSETQSTNAVLLSGDASNAAWTKQTATVIGAQITAPDGTLSGAKIIEGTGQVSPEVYQSSGVAGNAIFGVSAFFKAGTRSAAYLNIQSGSNNYVTAVFDLVAGAVGETTTGATSGTLVSANVRDVGNGWYRVSMIASVAVGPPLAVFGISDRATGNTFNAGGECVYTGDGTSYAYLWGMQSESAGVGVTSYLPTTSATATRAVDTLTLPLASLPGWSPSVGGVIAATYRLHTHNPSVPGFNQPAVMLRDVGGTNYVDMLADYSGTAVIRDLISVGGVLEGDLNQGPSSSAPFVRRTDALGWDVPRAAHAVDGTFVVGVDTMVSLPTGMTTMVFGGDGNVQVLNGTLERVAYYAGARSDAFITQVSR